MAQMILTIDTTQPDDRTYMTAIAAVLATIYPANPPKPIDLVKEIQAGRATATPVEVEVPVEQEATLPAAVEASMTAKQLQAAKARQAKADKAAAAAAAAEAAEAARIAALGAVEAPGGSGNGHDDGDIFDNEEPEPSTSLSPAEALDAGVALIRRIYQAGHTDAVRDITKTWGVVKFREIPVERGHDFHREAMALADRLGVR